MASRTVTRILPLAVLAACCLFASSCKKSESRNDGPPTKGQPEPGQENVKATPPGTTPAKAPAPARRQERTAYRQRIRGQIKGKGVNQSWGQIPGNVRLDLKKSSYNTYTYSADIEVQIHRNDGKSLIADYQFHDITATEAIGDRELSVNLKSGWLPPGLPTGINLTDNHLALIEALAKKHKSMLPDKASKLIDYAGEFLAFRSPELGELQDTALGLKGKKVRVTQGMGRSVIKGVGFDPTREQRDFIKRLSLSTDMELFPDDKKPGERWTADGGSLGFVFDPLMPGNVRGDVDVEFIEETAEGGVSQARLKVRRAPIDFVSDDGAAHGKFDGFGEVQCLLPARLIKNIDLNGGGEIRGVPKKHLLYGMQYEGQPRFEAISTTESIPYVKPK